MCIRDRCTPSGTLTASAQGDSSIRLNPTTVESFRIAQTFLTDAGIPYHTFALPEEKELKVQIIGIPADTTPEFIYNELINLGFKVNSVTPLFSPGKKVARNVFLFKIRKVGEYQAIYGINMLLYLKVRLEVFEAQAGPKQCYNCQRYSHSSAFCHHPIRCLRCGEGHRKDSCPSERAATTCATAGSSPGVIKGLQVLCCGFEENFKVFAAPRSCTSS